MDTKKFISFARLSQYHEQVKQAIKDATKDQVNYKDFTYNGENRRTIQLDNHNNISGIGTNCLEGQPNGYVGGEDLTGKGFNLVMLSKWNVADFGAAGIQANINTKGRRTIADGVEVPAVYVNDDYTLATTAELDTLKESLSDGVIEQVNKIVEGAPESLDTFKEIADWIANEDNKDAAAIVAGVNANTAAIGTPAKAAVGTEGEEGYEAPVAATGLYAAIEEAACRCEECTEAEIASLVFTD